MLQTSRSKQRDKAKSLGDPTPSTKTEPAPRLKVAKIGIVSRDYRRIRDFSQQFSDILKRLDDERCDTVLFSPWSIEARKSCRPSARLRRIKSVLYETFTGNGKKRKGKQFLVFYRRGNKWHRHALPGGGFPSLKSLKKGTVERFVRCVMPDRILGNCCVIVCGESNGVPYHQITGRVRDDFGLRRSLPTEVTVVLNPVHDRMTRHEMKKKRRFLSRNNRCVISVWNKGKRDKNGKTHDGTKHPWTVFHNGREVTENKVEPPNQIIEEVEIGIVEILGAQISCARLLTRVL
jgi:hypothetical protein